MKNPFKSIFKSRDEKIRERCLHLAKGSYSLAISYYTFIKKGYFVDYDNKAGKWVTGGCLVSPEKVSRES